MAKYYRFVSETEFQTLKNNGAVVHHENKLLHILSEAPAAFIVPSSTNYDLTIEELLGSDFPKNENFSKEQFLSYIAGPVSEDYLLELELDCKPSMSNLGWYYHEEGLELCVVEYLISSYTAEQVSAVYTGSFYSWKNIQHAPMSDYLTKESL